MEEAAGKDVIIVAGGIGLAPLRSVICQILSDRSKYGKVVLLYGARTPDDILYRSELQQWGSRSDMRVEVTVDRAPTTWQGTVGVVPSLISKASFDPRQAVAMLCGPGVMMHFAMHELERCGVETRQVYVSMERNMKCGVGLCGHCQFGPQFVCKEGPVFRYDRVAPFLAVREI
jgi:NAD(P)H-flavin reductase